MVLSLELIDTVNLGSFSCLSCIFLVTPSVVMDVQLGMERITIKKEIPWDWPFLKIYGGGNF